LRSNFVKMKEIKSREDIFLLVSTFYSHVKQDDFIGPIFLEIIPDDEWDSHIQKLTDFWQSNLFFQRVYKGNPLKKHINVDQKFDNEISQKHFGRWLQLWFSTVDTLFYGQKADEAKERARNIASLLFLRIYESRGITQSVDK